MDVRLPDGTIIEGVPDGTTKADLAAKLKKNGMAVPSEWLAAESPKAPERSFTEKAGDAIRDIPRQVGLTARYGLEGLGNAAEIVTNPIRDLVTDPLVRLAGGAPQRTLSDLVTGAKAGPARSKSTGEVATAAADWLGLPKPQTAGERVIGDAARMVAGSGGFVGAGRGLANAGAKTLGSFLSANPTVQASSAAVAGLAGGSVRESGGSEGEQVLASVLGGLAGAAAPAAVNSVTRAARNAPGRLADLVNPGRNTAAQPVDMQISARLEGTGVDWSTVPERVRQAVRQDVEQALKVGDDLNPEALRRLVDFRTVGATPTRGTLTLDPIQVTREKNLAKTGANSTLESAQRLANLEAANNQVLIRQLNDMGADATQDAARAFGDRGVGGLQGWLDSQKANVDRLYQAARDSGGRSAPLDGSSFTRRASELLDENLLGGSLPKDVETHLNSIAQGKVPFNVDYAEQLKTRIGKLQRGTSDGSARMALGVVRQALEETPLLNAGASLGDDAIGAFNSARTANRQMMQQIEKVPALKSLYDGKISPDDFIKRYVTSPTAKVRDVAEMVKVLDSSGKQALRDGVLGELKAAAVGTVEDEAARFSASAFRKALDRLGDRKLSLILSKDEINQLKALSRVADYTTAQPVSSAVNNSNSGALVVGKAMDSLNLLGLVPGMRMLGNLGSDGLKLAVRTSQQSNAMNAVPSIVLRPEVQRQLTLGSLARPASLSSALFAAPLSPQADQND
ncbi:hypothetical protein P245_25780 [Comamonas thiooxydans]|uniref:Uncharacterized protein n=1 Tax=Comamonas thiooxydans TaxID=363952 RepID=A0A0E3B998_9BURK|nr:hypothetical protein [Comamonas thiooxydans]KGG83039.1 hypothetical protein P245_25780 [Comamonas thiooxydans]